MGTYTYACIPFGEGLYQDDIASALGGIFDIGVHVCKRDGQQIADAFVTSGLAEHFEQQNPVFVAGKSSIELLLYMQPFLGTLAIPPAVERLERTPEYWLGWILGLFQVETGCSYRRVFQTIPYRELLDMYHPLHEAPEEKFFGILQKRLSEPHTPTKLKKLRDANNLSQSELAQKSGVGLRSIQMYEQCNKDINKAQALTLIRLARTLHCTPESLLEVG